MAETEFKYDVFVSYSSANKDWVRKDLLSALEKAGLKVCIDFRDFKAGKPAIKNMRDSILDSKHTLLILTEKYLESGWADFENMLSQTIDPANRKGRIVPLLKEKCELPLEIGYLTYVNFFDPDDWDIAWKQLFEALGKPETFQPSNVKLETREAWHLAHPYPMPPNFTGREAEQTNLDNWLSNDKDRLFILRALGGFGKSALTWQWINTHVNPAEWTKLVWWSFYEGDASFEHFIEETLKYLNLEVPQGQRPQVDALLKAMQGQKILLIMDGFERALRAYSSMNAAYQGDEESKLNESQYDCVNINTQIFLQKVCSLPNIKSKVLMTTRLTPRAVKSHDELLQGCFEKELKEMNKSDAVFFFHSQGIQCNRNEIETACAPYGFHPLSLRLLTGLITNNREKPGDIAITENLNIAEDIIQNQRHILEVAYNTLSTEEQRLLSNISCLRSGTNYQTIKVTHYIPSRRRKSTKGNPGLDECLKNLESCGLLQWERKVNRYDLHPIVRHYAYMRLNTSNRVKTHKRLRDHFSTIDLPTEIKSLDDLTVSIELYYHTVRAGELDIGGEFFYRQLSNPLYFQFGAYDLIIELVQLLDPNTQVTFKKIKNENIRAWMLSALASSYSDSGYPARALPLLKKQIAIREKQTSHMNIGIGLENLANTTQIPIGNLQDAEKSLQQSVKAFQTAGEIYREATSHSTLGKLFCYLGEWEQARSEMSIASQHFLYFPQSQGELETFHVLFYLLIRRDSSQNSVETQKSALLHAKRALELAKHQRDISDPNERSFIRAHWSLGSIYRCDNQFKLAEHHLLEEALPRCRSINLVVEEADILLDLARLRYAQENTEEAKSLAEEALFITERCGYVLQGADVNLFLAQYALEQEKNEEKAKAHAEEALKLAACDGPPYYYKVAYEEAERFLEKLK